MLESLIESKIKEFTFDEQKPYITLVLPLMNEDPYVVLLDLISEVKSKLKETKDSIALQMIYKKLNRLPVKLPPSNSCKGLVAFISEDFEEIIPLEAEVEKKTYVGAHFDFKDILDYTSQKKQQVNANHQEENFQQIMQKRYVQFQPFSKRTY